MSSPNLQSTRAQISLAVRRGDAQAEADARRTHATALLEKQITEVLADAPPLYAPQRYQLALLLLFGGRATSALTEAQVEAHIRDAFRDTVSGPGLTPDQRLRLAAIMRGLVR